MSRKTNATNGQVEKTIAKPAEAEDAPFQPVYFLSLEVENFRCFGPKQTLNLATEDGRPARWTVILGENGVGKTTLLRRLANFLPVERQIERSDGGDYFCTQPKFVVDGSYIDAFLDRKDEDRATLFSSNYGLGSFTDKFELNKNVYRSSVEVSLKMSVISNQSKVC